MAGTLGLARIAELATRSLATSAEAVAAVAELAHRLSGVDLTVVSEVTADGQYRFRGLQKSFDAPVERDAAIPYAWSLCSRIHAGESPATVPDTREVPALWRQWQRLKEGMAVEWDILAFCTRDVRLPDGTLFGTLCLHHTAPRPFTADEEALLEVLARLLGQEIWRERASRELEDALESLALAEQRRVELVEELRHELRAPLQVIDGYAEGMLDGVLGRDDEHVELVRREATRAAHLLDDLAALARLEADVDDDGAATGTLSLDDVAREMCSRLAPLAEAAGVDLTADVEPVVVRVPRKRLEQLVVNLVRNALRAVGHGEGSRVVVIVREAGDAASLVVEDDGPGITTSELARVFDRFYRGRSGRDAGTGSGLGLTIARRIAQGAGGTIVAEPVAPRGVRFVVSLPLARDQHIAGGKQPAAQA
ncbi:MAG TPA: GAF domain-containing sensor histidine kinase [Gaiella sp.]|jgi:signal transduction histidine kinase